MALFKFTDRILKGEPIDVYNNGNLSRDFTYIDDIIDGVTAIVPKKPDTQIPCNIYNIGRGEPVALEDFIRAIENATGKKAIRNNLPMQPGDVERTWADTKAIEKNCNYFPNTNLDIGVKKFVYWFKKHSKR